MEYLIGLILGAMMALSGAGGVIAVPLIMIFFNLPINEAMGTALGAVMLSAVVGLVIQRKNVLYVPGFILGLTGMISAPLGRTFATQINELILLLGFLSVSTVIAVLMWQSARKELTIQKGCGIEPLFIAPVIGQIYYPEDKLTLDAGDTSTPAEVSALKYDWLCILSMLFSGLLIGALSGLLGIGGGVFMVPFLAWFLNIKMIAAIATAMLTVLLISASGFFTGLLVHNQVELLLTVKLAIAAMLGTMLGHRVGFYCKDQHLQKLFSVSLMFMSLLALVKEI